MNELITILKHKLLGIFIENEIWCNDHLFFRISNAVIFNLCNYVHTLSLVKRSRKLNYNMKLIVLNPYIS